MNEMFKEIQWMLRRHQSLNELINRIQLERVSKNILHHTKCVQNFT